MVKKNMNRGFTLIELLVSIGIFVIMTTLVVTKYGTFNQSTLLTDTAYDVALVIRLSQSYGLSVKSSDIASGSSFLYPFGVEMSSANTFNCGTSEISPTTLTLYADTSPLGSPDHVCDAADTSIDTYKVLRGAVISSICAGANAASCVSASRISVSYQRPNPEAIICTNGLTSECGNLYAEISVRSTDGFERKIVVRQNGQISVAK